MPEPVHTANPVFGKKGSYAIICAIASAFFLFIENPVFLPFAEGIK
jgi:hypothetical protein